MHATLEVLSRLVATPPRKADAATVVAACEAVGALLGAGEAYVLRAGDPSFVRMGSEIDPTDYEIKQRGYWHAWRQAAADPEDPARVLTVSNRLVEEVLPLAPGVPATHLAAILPGQESNSEILIVRGPWPEGVTPEQVSLLATIRPLMAHLVANVLDAERQERVRSQMRVLADVAEAFSQADDTQGSLGSLATALARASGFAWVAILLIDPQIEKVLDRAVNLGRHSNTETAAQGRQGRESENSVARDIAVARHIAWTRQPYCVPDVSDPAEQLLVNDELRPYYERAHIISMASFPVFVQEQMLGTITFCGSEQHDFGAEETEFLWSLVAQAGPTIKAFRLNADLREAEQRLRAVFSNAPVFITVFEADGTILLSEGAGLGRLGQTAGALVGQTIYEALPEPFHEMLRGNIERGLRGENFDSSLQVNGRDLQTRYAALRDDEGVATAVIGVTMDISEQVGAQRQLEALNQDLQTAIETAEFLASHDTLTGVLSRRAWFEAAAKLPVTALAVFDIDRFKGINDRWGHPAGDVVLKMVTERIAGGVGSRGVVGRLGGEEFGVLFTAPIGEARELCQGAVDAVGRDLCILPDGRGISVSVSAGLAPCAGLDGEPEAIQRAYARADAALYEAKDAGRHRLVVARAA